MVVICTRATTITASPGRSSSSWPSTACRWLAWRVRRGWPGGRWLLLLLLIGARAGAGWCDVALTTKQQAFIEHYLRTWNASQAARDAGYSEKTARAIGAENLTKPDIQAAIQGRLAQLKMGADEVLTRLTDHARGSIAPFLRVSPSGILAGFDLGDDKPLHLLRKASVTTRTFKGITEETTTIELYDAQAALVHLGKHHKLFTDNIAHSGALGVKTYQTVSPDDWDDAETTEPPEPPPDA